MFRWGWEDIWVPGHLVSHDEVLQKGADLTRDEANVLFPVSTPYPREVKCVGTHV